MYTTCPECQHQRAATDTSNPDVCPACGLIFSKWMQNRFRSRETVSVAASADESRFRETLTSLLYVPPADSLSFYGRVIAFIIFLIWGLYFVSLGMAYEPIGNSFMHNINLVFHEAGHVIFRLFGRFMTILGGSLFQIMVPLFLALALLIKNHDNFGAAIGFWWTGQSMIDIAPYIDDARSLSLPLLGGGTGMDRPGMHDWRNILLDLNMLQHDHAIANAVMLTGKIILLLALCWAARYIWIQRKQLHDD